MDYLPAVHRLADWVLLYNSADHGTSLRTFYRMTANKGPTLVAVIDEEGRVFGGFAPVSWSKSEHYYGVGDGFLFTTVPSFTLYRSTRKNDYVQLSDDSGIGLGGGSGRFGLFLDNQFVHGATGRCATFENSPLTGGAEEFRIIRVEVFGFDVEPEAVV